MKKILILILWITSNSIVWSQQNPLEVAKLVFSENPPQNLDSFLTKTFAHLGFSVKQIKNNQLKFLLLSENLQTAIVHIQIMSDTLKPCPDSYVYFEKQQDVWKINDIKQLRVTNFTVDLLNHLASLSEGADSLNKQKVLKSASEKEIKEIKLNLSLILSSDEGLMTHFKQNKSQFDDLKNKIIPIKDSIRTAKPLKTENGPRYDYSEPFQIQKKVLGLTKIGDYNDDKYEDLCKSCIDFIIGGSTCSHCGRVGYLYIPDPIFLPKMSPNHYFMIRNIGDGWYLYKSFGWW